MNAFARFATGVDGTAQNLSGEIFARGIPKMKYCKVCRATDHTQFYCPKKPRTRLKANKSINRVGKVQKKTATAVAKWKKTIRPNHQGYYVCYICGKWVDYNMAEHVKSKVRAPDLRTNPNNFKTVCAECNEIKGSKDLNQL